MPLLRDFVGQPLRWVRPRLFRNVYELRTGDTTLATLSRSGVFKSRTLAVADGRQWIFTREGAWKPRLVIYSGDSSDSGIPGMPPQPLASIRRNWKGRGELIFNDGRTYSWTSTGFWRPSWSLVAPWSVVLLTMKRGHVLEIAPAASDLPELPMLVLFAFYLILIAEEEAAAAAAGTAAGCVM
jgi:hypothetical protein